MSLFLLWRLSFIPVLVIAFFAAYKQIFCLIFISTLYAPPVFSMYIVTQKTWVWLAYMLLGLQVSYI